MEDTYRTQHTQHIRHIRHSAAQHSTSRLFFGFFGIFLDIGIISITYKRARHEQRMDIFKVERRTFADLVGLDRWIFTGRDWRWSLGIHTQPTMVRVLRRMWGETEGGDHSGYIVYTHRNVSTATLITGFSVMKWKSPLFRERSYYSY